MRDQHTPRPSAETRPAQRATDRWSVVGRLVDDALDLPLERRREFVDQACGTDSELRGEVGKLLAACERAERGTGFLDGAAGEFAEPLMAQLSAHVQPGALSIPADVETALGERYTLERELGRGGMAVVYLAQDFRIGRRVAVKVLRPDLAMALGQERFIREIRTVASLTHPHVVPLLDTGEIAATVYFTMPYVEGESLREKLDHEPQLPLDTALGIAAQVADALDCAHRHNIVHRDIKPDNILLQDGHAVVADFGVARAIARAGGEELEEKLTATGVTFGTPAYMSPEQASGDRAIDGRSDIYSLGSVLYEMLAGEPPYHASSTAALLTKIMTFPVPSLQIDRPGLPDAVDKLVQRCLAKAPADRYQTAAELRDALRGVGRGGPVPAADTAPAPASSIGPESAHGVAAVVQQSEPAREKTAGIATFNESSRDWSWRNHGLLASGVIALLLVSARAWSDRAPSHDVFETSRFGAPSPLRVAVFPFVVNASGTSSEYLGEAAMDLLSGAIDGVGELRRVDPRALMSRLRRERSIDVTDVAPLEAKRISREFGAGRFVLGTATVLGDRVHISASLYDLARGDAPVATEAGEGVADSLSLLVTEVSRALFASHPVGTGGRLTSMDAMRAANHDAERAYLEGEALLRRGATDSAARAFRQALAADSTFALAWYRLSHAEDFNGPGRAAPMMRSIDAAIRHGGQLSTRDRLLVEAHHAFTHGDGALAERRALQVVGEFPDQVEGWWLLATTRLWHAWQWGRSPQEARAPLERALRLDPDHPASLYQAMWVAGFGRRWAAADSLLTRVEASQRNFSWGTIRSRAVSAFDRKDTLAQAALIAELWQREDFDLVATATSMALYTDHLDGARRVAYVLTDPARRSGSARARGHLLAALTRAAAGQLPSARAEFTRAASHDSSLALAYDAWVNVIPALQSSHGTLDSLRERLERWRPPSDSARSSFWFGMPPGLYPNLKDYLLGLANARLGNRDAALAHASRLEEARVIADSAGLLPDLAREIRALVAIHDGRPGVALEILEGASMKITWHYEVTSPLHRRPLGRYLRAELLFSAGREGEALGWLESFGSIAGPEFVFLGPTYRRQAQIHDHLGNRSEAIDYYTRFVSRWNNADAALQPLVEEARLRVVALDRESVRRGRPSKAPPIRPWHRPAIW